MTEPIDETRAAILKELRIVELPSWGGPSPASAILDVAVRYRIALKMLENHHQGLTPMQLRIVDRALYPEKELVPFETLEEASHYRKVLEEIYEEPHMDGWAVNRMVAGVLGREPLVEGETK